LSAPNGVRPNEFQCTLLSLIKKNRSCVPCYDKYLSPCSNRVWFSTISILHCREFYCVNEIYFFTQIYPSWYNGQRLYMTGLYAILQCYLRKLDVIVLFKSPWMIYLNTLRVFNAKKWECITGTVYNISMTLQNVPYKSILINSLKLI